MEDTTCTCCMCSVCMIITTLFVSEVKPVFMSPFLFAFWANRGKTSLCMHTTPLLVLKELVLPLKMWIQILANTGMGPYICRATTRPPRPSSTAECLRLIARLRGEQASAASWEPRPPFEAAEMD